MTDKNFERSDASDEQGKQKKRGDKVKRKVENITTGQLGEQLAADYLEGCGWTIIERNYKTRIGEIDLIVQRAVSRGLGQVQILAFVEVKTRRNTRRASPADAVTAKKRKKLSVLALLFVQRYEIRHVVCRFDVISVDLGSSPAKITHIENAFDVMGRIR